MDFQLDEIIVAKQQTPTTEIDGQVVVLSLADGGLYGLDPVASRIWEWLRAPRSFGELVGLVTGEFDVDEGTARADLKDLLAELRARGLV